MYQIIHCNNCGVVLDEQRVIGKFLDDIVDNKSGSTTTTQCKCGKVYIKITIQK